MENKTVALPFEVFSELMQVVSSLPYNKVAGVIRKVEQSARQIEDAKPTEGKKEEKKNE